MRESSKNNLSFTDYEVIKSADIITQTFDILPTANDVTYKRMKMAARELEKLEESVNSEKAEKLLRVIFDQDVKPSLAISHVDYNFTKTDISRLNEAQRKVVVDCVRHPELFCIHGI